MSVKIVCIVLNNDLQKLLNELTFKIVSTETGFKARIG